MSAIRHFHVRAGAAALACVLAAAAHAEDCRFVTIGTATVRAAHWLPAPRRKNLAVTRG